MEVVAQGKFQSVFHLRFYKQKVRLRDLEQTLCFGFTCGARVRTLEGLAWERGYV